MGAMVPDLSGNGQGCDVPLSLLIDGSASLSSYTIPRQVGKRIRLLALRLNMDDSASADQLDVANVDAAGSQAGLIASFTFGGAGGAVVLDRDTGHNLVSKEGHGVVLTTDNGGSSTFSGEVLYTIF